MLAYPWSESCVTAFSGCVGRPLSDKGPEKVEGGSTTAE